MGQQQIAGNFRTADQAGAGVLLGGGGINLQDAPASATSNWTQGGTLIDSVPIQPPLGQVYNIVSWTIAFQGFWGQTTGGAPSYGKVGSILGAVMRASQRTFPPTPTSFNDPWTNPMLPLPNDVSLAATLWDSNQDQAFPTITAKSLAGLIPAPTITGGLVLNTPIQIVSGEQISIGLWLMPSLVANVQIWIANAQYAINLDDGQPPQGGWGGP